MGVSRPRRHVVVAGVGLAAAVAAATAWMLAQGTRGAELANVLALLLLADTGDPAPADVSFAQPALIY